MLSVHRRQTDAICCCYNLFQECTMNNLFTHKWQFLLWGLTLLHSFYVVSTFSLQYTFLDQINHVLKMPFVFKLLIQYIALNILFTNKSNSFPKWLYDKSYAFNNMLLFFVVSLLLNPIHSTSTFFEEPLMSARCLNNCNDHLSQTHLVVKFSLNAVHRTQYFHTIVFFLSCRKA